MTGCGVLRFYQDPSSVEVHRSSDQGFDQYFADQQRAFEQHHSRMIPLAAANVLLSALLIVACARALASKPNAHNLAIQAVAANILYALVDYVVSAPIRDAVIASAASRAPPGDIALDPSQFAAVGAWVGRLLSVAHVTALGLVAYALTRPRVIALFQPDDEPPSEEA